MGHACAASRGRWVLRRGQTYLTLRRTREALLTAGLTMEALNWLGDGSLEAACDQGLPVLARVRSTREPLPAHLGWSGDEPAVFFDIPEEGVAKGQACVLYDFSSKSRVLGGGFIASTIAADERLSA